MPLHTCLMSQHKLKHLLKYTCMYNWYRYQSTTCRQLQPIARGYGCCMHGHSKPHWRHLNSPGLASLHGTNTKWPGKARILQRQTTMTTLIIICLQSPSCPFTEAYNHKPKQILAPGQTITYTFSHLYSSLITQKQQ